MSANANVWMQENKWLTTYIIIFILGVGGLGYFVYDAYGTYQESLEEFEGAKNTVMGLKRKNPFPNDANVKAYEDELALYRKEIAQLKANLKPYVPIRRTTDPTKFAVELQNGVNKKLEEAAARTPPCTLPEDFYLGMDRYRIRPPEVNLIPDLIFQKEVIEDMVKLLMTDLKVDAITELTRTPAAKETGTAAPDPRRRNVKKEKPVMEKYTVNLCFKARHSAVEKFVNTIANGKFGDKRTYFVIIRLIRIKNEKTIGPPREVASAGTSPPFGGATTTDVIGAPGTENQKDARIILGDERVNVCAVLEIVRFLEGVTTAAPAPSGR